MIRSFAVLSIVCFCSATASAETVVSSFDSSVEGWAVINNGTSLPSHVPTGGNPDGYLEETDETSGAYTLVAPAAFLGNLASFVGGQMRFDAILLDLDGFAVLDQGGTVTIRSGALAATRDFAPGGLTEAWDTYQATLTAAAWGVSESTWNSLIADVTAIEIIMDATMGNDTTGLDNFAISEPVAVPGLSWRSAIVMSMFLMAIAVYPLGGRFDAH